MLKWLRKLFAGPPRFDITPALSRCRPVRMRRYARSDFDICCDIYRRNAPGRFPDGYFSHFVNWLQSGNALMLVAEDGGQVVAFGGIAQTELARVFVLLFGMVDPRVHRRGYGTMLLLARLAALPEPKDGYVISMTTTGGSERFYSRFGFRPDCRIADSKGVEFDSHYVLVGRREWQACCHKLEQARVVMEVPDIAIPIAIAEQQCRVVARY